MFPSRDSRTLGALDEDINGTKPRWAETRSGWLNFGCSLVRVYFDLLFLVRLRPWQARGARVSSSETNLEEQRLRTVDPVDTAGPWTKPSDDSRDKA
jgi:hypothetical protein